MKKINYKIIAIICVAVFLIVSLVLYGIYLFSYHLSFETEYEYFIECTNPRDRIPNTLPEYYNSETGMYYMEYERSNYPASDKLIYTIKGSISGGFCHLVEKDENDKILLDITFDPGVDYDETITVYNCGEYVYSTLEFSEEAFGSKSLSIISQGYVKGYNLDFK